MADDDKKPYHERYRPAPPPDYMRYLTAPFTGYWDRQGKLAREGLAMAEDGARRTRSGDLSGYLGQFLGPLAYASSPINALIPTEQEAYAAFDGNTAPFVAGGLGAASMFLPGSKRGMRPRGLSDLVDDVTDAERAALQRRLQAEAGQTGGAANATTRDQALTNLTEAPPEGITAYHGSPHTFDKFSMDKIGTGEGAQAYGHGLYFAESPEVATSYRDMLARTHLGGNDGQALTQSYLSDAGGDVAALRNNLETELKDANLHPTARKRAESVLQYLRENPNPEPKGSMYQVRINAKPEEFLDWDRPLSEQPETVRGALKGFDPSTPAVEAYVKVGQKLGQARSDSPLAAKWMQQQGIKGIRYKDQGSRGAEGGTYNYVVFDDKIIDILKRYGIPFTLGAGGAAMVSGGDMPEEIAAQMGPQG